MARIKIPGKKVDRLDNSIQTGRRADGLLNVVRRGAIRVEAARGTDDVVSQIDGVSDESVVALQIGEGITLWVRGDEFRQDYMAKRSRATKADEWEVNPILPIGGPSREIGATILKGLEVFDIKPQKNAAKLLAKKVEAQLDRAPGLYACVGKNEFQLSEKPAKPTGPWPILIFIHGTASSSRGSFSELWSKDNRKHLNSLVQQYDGRLYAFEHPTLTESPLSNVLMLIRSLPEGARVHLVSHSRGGLVGEILCRSQRTDSPNPFEDREVEALFPDKNADRDMLADLNREFKTRKICVERFVRVACPVRGTTIASGRLDRWLNMVVNVIGLIPALKGNPIYEVLTDFLLAVVKERTQADTLPGLAAQMPGSALVQLLNIPGVQVNSDLSVISGDIEGKGIFGSLKLLAPDRFFEDDHDLVVNTGSMYGGASRGDGGRFFFDKGTDVNHFRYFRNERSVEKLVSALTSAEAPPTGFTPLVQAAHKEPARAVKTPSGPRPVTFLIPGIMGTHLAVKGIRVWINMIDLAFGGLRKISIDAPDVQPQELVSLAYQDLIHYLGETREVVTFPYDWRLSVRDAGTQLAEMVQAKLNAVQGTDQPVQLIGHSLGGLVVRAMIADHPHIWKRLCEHPQGRFIMLGTPNGGSYDIVRVLVGQASLLRNLALIDIKHSMEELSAILVQFPGILELLPTDNKTNFFDHEVWQHLHGTNSAKNPLIPSQARLRHARETLTTIEGGVRDPRHMLYVAGVAPTTSNGLEILDENTPDSREIRFSATTNGDGKVLWKTGMMPNIPTWYMNATHGDLADHAPAFPALLELLQTGDTRLLDKNPPVRAREVQETFELPPDEVIMIPDEEGLIQSSLGHRKHKQESSKTLLPKMTVSVTHGNLGYAKYPVAVGHYFGDTIVGAEAHLDWILNGRLRTRQRLGLYPGSLETCEILFNPDPYQKPGGALVIGLGKVGELSPGSLTASVTRAALTYALTIAEYPNNRYKTDPDVAISATITSLLIGTGAGGLSIEESVQAILRGIKKANLQLQSSGQDKYVRIDQLEFVELWQDVAIQAIQAIRHIEDDPDLKDFIKCHPTFSEMTLQEGTGGLTRIAWDEDGAWWHRLEILGEQDGALRFKALTDRARSEVRLLPTQRALVDQFIEQAITTTKYSQETARTLFDLLLPNRLKEQAPQRYNLVLLLNETSAGYPWELLEDRSGDGSGTLSLDVGIVRQLETNEFREQISTILGNYVLVVGEPLTEKFVPLPGAREEAETVAKLLENEWSDYRVETSINANAESIITALHRFPYRILHLAGHGVHEHELGPNQVVACQTCGQQKQDTEHKKISGMVLGDNIFLTPADVEQMRQVPDLVFMNCCHLGRTESTRTDTPRHDRHKFAANIAAQFIRMGVRTVIAAGWAVDDGAAKTFAETFYRQMLKGYSFGNAVWTARRETYKSHPNVNTWGAYQCYGDPDFTLTADGVAWEESTPVKFASPSEVVVAFHNLTNRAKTANDDQIDQLRKLTEKIVDQSNMAWFQRADIAAAKGLALGELGDFQAAIECLGIAIKANKAEFPVRAIEQRANFLSRWAVEIWKTESSTPRKRKSSVEKSVNLISQAIKDLQTLGSFENTGERLSLLGSAYKRLIWISSPAQQRKHFKDMTENYKKAHDIASDFGKKPLATYPLLNWLIGRTIQQWGRKKTDPVFLQELKNWCQKAQEIAATKDKEDPNFWNSVTEPDFQLLKCVAESTLATHQGSIVKGYQNARRRGASPREFRSILEHIEFLETIANSQKQNTIARDLKKIREQLSSQGS